MMTAVFFLMNYLMLTYVTYPHGIAVKVIESLTDNRVHPNAGNKE